MRYKAIIFDLDGVLVFTDHYHYLAWKQLAQRLDVYFDEQINERLRGVSRMESLMILLERWQGAPFTQEQLAAMAEEKNQTYRALLSDMSPQDVSQDVRNTLDALKQAGVVLAIGSSSKNAGFILARTALEPYFTAVADGNCITNSKPHPEVFLKAAQLLGLRPAQCLVVEDAQAGIEAACAGGFAAAGIGSAFHAAGTSYRLGSLPELLQL